MKKLLEKKNDFKNEFDTYHDHEHNKISSSFVHSTKIFEFNETKNSFYIEKTQNKENLEKYFESKEINCFNDRSDRIIHQNDQQISNDCNIALQYLQNTFLINNRLLEILLNPCADELSIKNCIGLVKRNLKL